MTRIFNIISWLGIALVVGAVGIRFGLPAQEKYATYLAWAGLACIVVYILSQWREIGGFFGSRSGRYGTLAASSLLIVLGILVAVNYIGRKQNKRWDLTTSGQYSLSDQSRSVVQKLDAPLTVMVSSSDPTCIAMFTVAVKPVPSVMPSRLMVEKPVRLNVTV